MAEMTFVTEVAKKKIPPTQQKRVHQHLTHSFLYSLKFNKCGTTINTLIFPPPVGFILNNYFFQMFR